MENKMNELTEDFELVWDVLQEYREETKAVGFKSNDRRWEKLCNAMARIEERANG